MSTLEPDAINRLLTAVATGTPRMLAALAMLPFFTRQNLAALHRTAIAIVFSLPALPFMDLQAQQHALAGGSLFLLILKESAIGFILGFALAIPFWATEGLGFVIDNQRGATTSGMANPMSGDDSSPLAILINQSYVVLFLSLYGLNMVIGVVYQSYALWPISAPMPRFDPAFATHFLGLLDNLMRTAIVLAAPAMIAMLLAELALAFVSMFAPQMQVFFLAMPIKSGIALFVLVIYFSTLMDYLALDFARFRSLLDTMAKLMR
jgi:type III secretion protein T